MVEVGFKLSTFKYITFNYYFIWPINNVLYFSSNMHITLIPQLSFSLLKSPLVNYSSSVAHMFSKSYIQLSSSHISLSNWEKKRQAKICWMPHILLSFSRIVSYHLFIYFASIRHCDKHHTNNILFNLLKCWK